MKTYPMSFKLDVHLDPREVEVLVKKLCFDQRRSAQRIVIKQWAESIIHAAIVDYQSNQDSGID